MRTSTHSHRILRAAPAAASLLLLLNFVGCSKSTPVGPLESGARSVTVSSAAADAGGFGSGDFYPLATGNAWDYEGVVTLRDLNPDGTPGAVIQTISYTESHRILGTESRDGHSYFVREDVRVEDVAPDDPWTIWTRMRQDRTGLYAAADGSDVPPVLDGASAPVLARGAAARTSGIDFAALRARGFTEEGIARFEGRVARLRDAVRGLVSPSASGARASAEELTWLLYPARIGREWNMVPGFIWPVRVDGIEMRSTAAGSFVAYRLETNPTGEPLGEGEHITLYYGRAGFLGLSVRIRSTAFDQDGNPLGDVVYEDVASPVSIATGL
ncbi:MAG TPA: hypothetical protein VFU59_02195 [Candidatus Eisenbacteria bacterium]|nr:hypothetical protein [Candidatus Eisenbacteria bacterium]